jgi:hypothetical protein
VGKILNGVANENIAVGNHAKHIPRASRAQLFNATLLHVTPRASRAAKATEPVPQARLLSPRAFAKLNSRDVFKCRCRVLAIFLVEYSNVDEI